MVSPPSRTVRIATDRSAAHPHFSRREPRIIFCASTLESQLAVEHGAAAGVFIRAESFAKDLGCGTDVVPARPPLSLPCRFGGPYASNQQVQLSKVSEEPELNQFAPWS